MSAPAVAAVGPAAVGPAAAAPAPPVVNRIAAETMLAAVESDPQLSPPQRPVFCPDVLVVDLPDGILVEGAPERAVFRGAAARTLLPALLPLMDGSRGPAELSADLPEPTSERSVRAAIALLYTAGLVHDSPWDAPEIPAAIPAPVVAAVRRTLDSTRVHRSPGAAFASIAGSRVLLLATGDTVFTRQLAAQLTATGDAVILGDPADRIELVVNDLVVLVEDRSTTAGPPVRAGGSAGAWARRCTGAGAAALRVVVSNEWVEIGPRFDARYSICPDCLSTNDSPLAEAAPSVGRSAARTTTAAALAAMEIFAQRVRVGTARALTGSTRIQLDSLRTEPRLATRRPGCLDGHRLDGQHDERVVEPLPAGYVYDQSVGFPPKSLLDPKGHQVHYKVGNIVIQHEHRSYGSAERVPLPRADLHLPRPTPTRIADDPTLETLSHLLLATFGLKPVPQVPRVLRYAPTGGNLGSPQGFVIAESVPGLAPGVYYYESFDHQLSRLADLTPATIEVLRAAGLAKAPAHVVFTAAYARVAHKYGMLAWRICCLDAGVAVAQAMAVAGPEFGVRRAEQFDPDQLAALLGLDPTDDPVTAVLQCGHPELPALLDDSPLSSRDAADPPEIGGLVDRGPLMAALLGNRSRAGTFGTTSTISTVGTARMSATSVTGGRCRREVTLPAASLPSVDLRAAIAVRRAERFYDAQPVDPATLRAICSAALGPADRVAGGGHELTLTVVARSVDRVPAGVYTYRPGGVLELDTALSGDPAELTGTVLQLEFAASPVILVVTGATGPVSHRYGVDGYRRLLVDGAEAAHRAWLAALRRGLIGSTFAGLLGPDLYRLGGVDGYFRGGLLGLSLGLPRGAGSAAR